MREAEGRTQWFESGVHHNEDDHRLAAEQGHLREVRRKNVP